MQEVHHASKILHSAVCLVYSKNHSIWLDLGYSYNHYNIIAIN